MTHARGLRAGFVFAVATAGGCSGLSQSDLESGAPNMTVSVSVDAASYARNAPVIAEVSITNAGEKPVSITLPGRETMEFNLFTPASPDPLNVDFVSSEREVIEWQLVEPDETLKKRFVLPLAARSAGSFRLIAVYRSEPSAEMVGSLPIASTAAAYAVTDPPAFERDSTGVISENDAKRVAEKFFARPAKTSRAHFAIDEKDLGVWLVTVEFNQPDKDGNAKHACLVDAYLGEVRRKPVPDDAEKYLSKSQPPAGS